MKILITGSEKEYSLSRFYSAHFRRIVDEVRHLPVQDTYLEILNRSMLNRLINRISPSLLLNDINDGLVEEARIFKPDVVLIFKGLEIYSSTLIALRSMGIKLVNYNPDHPFMENARGSINSNIRSCIPHYDLHISYNRSVCEQFQQKHKLSSAWVPFGYELSDELYARIIQEKEVHSMCFLGNPDEKRASLVKRLAVLGYPIDLYGNHWGKYVSGLKNVHYYPAKYGDEFWYIIRQYRLQLNAFRAHNEGSHNMRTFDVPAAGGILLSPHSEEQEMFFTQGKEAFFYHSTEEAIQLAKQIMELSESEANKIRKNARDRSIDSKYGYYHRAGEMIHVIAKLLQEDKK